MFNKTITIIVLAFVLSACHSTEPQSFENWFQTSPLSTSTDSLESVPGYKALRTECEDFIPYVLEDGRMDEVGSRWLFSLDMKEKVQKKKMLKWESLGPNVMPIENESEGRAIPKSARNRGNGTGRINFLLLDPYIEGRIFACSPTGGLFVTYDNGENWLTTGTDSLPIAGCSSITVNPEDPKNWIIATGDSDDTFMFSDGVWRTFDSGQTWENINGRKWSKSLLTSELLGQQLYVSKVLAHPCDFNRVFVASNKGLYVTNNALDEVDKVRWNQVSDSHFYDIEVCPWDNALVFASGQKFLMSTDCGNNWSTEQMPDVPESYKYPFKRISIEFSEDDEEYIWAAVTCAEKASQSKSGAATLQKFHLKRRRWTNIRSLKSKMNNMIVTRARAFDVNPKDTAEVLVGNVQPLFRSTNGGRDFSRIERNQMHDDVHHIEFKPDGKEVWASHDGGVSVSYDGGVTWESKCDGIGVANIFGLSVAQSEERILLYGGYDTGCNLYKDGVWKHVTWGDGFQTAFDPVDSDIMYTTKQHGHMNRSDDGGIDFDQTVTCGVTRTDWHSWIRTNPVYGDYVYCAGDRLVRSKNKGKEWEIILDVWELGDHVFNTYKFFLCPEHPDVMYVYLLDQTKFDPIIMRTFNVNDVPEKIKWETLPSIGTPSWISGLVIDSDDPKQFWVTRSDYDPKRKILRYNGQRYIDVSSNLEWCVIRSVVIDDADFERIYLGTNYGVFTRNKKESEWTLLQGLPSTYIWAMDINRVTGKLVVGTYGRGVWETSLVREEL